MRMTTKFLGIAAALMAFAAGAHAQTAVFVAAGSSALFLEAGQAVGSATTASPAGVGATCLWSQSSGLATSLTVTDTATETGNAWIAWTPEGSPASCSTVNSSTKIYVYVQTDSVLGNRLYFNGGTLSYVSTNPSGSASSGLIFGTSGEQALNATVWSTVSGKALTAAGTDIRPEDAAFATLRVHTNCGADVDSSLYTGLGYAYGTSIDSYYSTSTFHVENFTLPTTGFTAIPVGATPIIFAVNTTNTTNGFGTGVSNITPTTLAKYFGGDYGSTSDLTGAAGSSPATVLIREPLSGTYNTTEYTSVDTVALGNAYSQDAGNCDGTVPNTNPFHVAASDRSGGYRNRAIGTGEEIKEILNVKDAFGYGFWSAANWKSATNTGVHYLTINGYDPLYNPSASTYSTTTNLLPTTTNGYLPDVTFTDLNNGDYPAWSALRIVTASSGTNYTYANKVAQSLQNFISTTTQPDFIPFASLTVWREHFNPPGQSVTPNDGDVDGTTCGTEVGGDVGGEIMHPPACTTGTRQ